MKRSRLRSVLVVGVKVLVSVGLIVLVLRGFDARTVGEHLREADGLSIAGAIAIITAVALLHAKRWCLVLECMGHRLAFREALRLVLVGYFFNQTLPSTVGGDAYRAWGAYHSGIRVADAVTSVLADRIFALLALVLMILMGLWWLFDIVKTPAARGLVALTIGGAIVGTGVLLSLNRIAALLQRWRITRLLLHVSAAARAVFARPPALAGVALATLAGYTAVSFAVYLLARGMQVPLGFAESLLLIPLVTLVAVLPISIAGWGLRESAMVVALGLIGVPAAQAFALSVLYGLAVMASGAPGGVWWLLSRHKTRPAPSAESEGSRNPG